MVREKPSLVYFRVGVFVALAAALAFSSSLAAQTFRGSIIGLVSDPTGAGVAGATVTAKNVGTGILRTTETTADGTYSIPELPVGIYEVTVTLTGFQTTIATGVSVEVARDRHVDFSLKPGALSQRVEVTEQGGVPIETTNNNQGGSFQGVDLVDLPINGRDINKAYVMAPGISGDPSGAGGEPGSYGQFSANGNRDRANNFLLDGTDMNDSYRNLPAINQGAVFAIPGTILPVETIAEVRILTNFEAEYGRSSGAVVNIVTKSGTNDIHGSAFEYFRNRVLNARNFFNNVGPQDAFRNNQFGGAFGGPIKKNKTFYYVGYEGQREGLGLASVNAVPSLANYSTAITNLGGNPANCTTTVIACIDGNAAVVNPVIKNFYDFCNKNGHCSGGNSPWPAANIANPQNGLNNVSSDRAHNNVDSVIAKIDHAFNSSNLLSARYFYGQSGQSLPLGTGGGNALPNTNTFSPTDVNLVSVSLVTTISPTQVNEARFGYNRYHEGFFAQDANVFGNPNLTLGLNNCLGTVTGSTVNTCASTAGGTGLANSKDFGLPQMTFSSGLSGLGSSRFSNPRERFDRNYQFVDDFDWKFSKNDVKMGVEYRHSSIDSLNDINFRGRMKFGDLTGFLGGTPTGGQISYGDTRRSTNQDSFGLFIQDSWQILPRLTVNAGIRYDNYGVIRESIDGISVYNPLSTGFGLAPAHDPYSNNMINFGPRLGLAWDPFGKGKTVVRAGVGVFYDSFSFDYFLGQLFENTNNVGPAYNAVGSNPILLGNTATVNPLAVNVPVFHTTSVPCVTAASSCAAPAPMTLNADTTDATTVGRLRTPYVYNFSFNVQQEVTRNTVLEVGYVGTQGRHLQRIVDLNQPSQAAISAYDLTCADLTNSANPFSVSVGSCPTGIGVPRNFNNSGGTPLPGQITNAAIMSALSPQTPFYLQQLQTSARSAYNSLVVSLTQRNWHGITQQVNYTWSHAIDDASDGQDFVPHSGQPNDSTNPHASNVGNANFDVRNHFVWALTYAFPSAHSLGKFGSGWSISSVVTALSGHPVELVNALDDYDGSGEFFGRPDVVGPIKYNFSNPNQWLDLSAFAVQCTLDGKGIAAVNCLSGSRHFGTLGRNALKGPPFRQWDFSLVKDTKLTERFKLQLRADVFNILNHPNFSNPLLPSAFDDASGFASPDSNGKFRCPAGLSSACATPGSQFFPIVATVDTGIGNPILGGGGPRSIQFAAKLIF